MIYIEIIQYCFATAVGLLLGYQMLLSFFALRGKKTKDLEASRSRKFAIVLLAHDEDTMISRSLYSLSGFVYPKNLYDLIVIVDSFEDKAAIIANKLGAIVLERLDSQDLHQKHSLQWAFDQILQWDNYDAVVVFDSDSLVSGNYLEVMNYYLDHGSKVIQSNDSVLPQPNEWSIEATRLKSLLYNYVKPMGRKVLGLNTMLRGNGMCFSSDALLQNPWQFGTITEYGVTLQLKGIDIDYAPEANTWIEISEETSNGRLQNSWWEKGRYRMIRKYSPRLIAEIFRQRPVKFIDILLDLVTPPLVNMLLFIIAMCSVSIFSWSMGWTSLSFVWTWLAIAGFGVVHLLVGLVAAGADRQLYKSVFYIPIYVLWRIKVSVQKFFTRDKEEHLVPKVEPKDMVSNEVEGL